jgi:hypothetical protein
LSPRDATAVLSQLPGINALAQCPEPVLRLGPGERCPDAVVNSLAEGDMAPQVGPLDLYLMWAWELGAVAPAGRRARSPLLGGVIAHE